MHSCLTARLAQAAGFRFIDAPAAADGPLLKGAMWYPCWLPQQIEYARFQLGGIVVPVAVDLPVYAVWCISVFGAPPLYRNVRLAESVVRSYMQRGGDATRLRRRASDVACETPCYLHSEIDRQLAVGTVGILLPIDKKRYGRPCEGLHACAQSPKLCPARRRKPSRSQIARRACAQPPRSVPQRRQSIFDRSCRALRAGLTAELSKLEHYLNFKVMHRPLSPGLTDPWGRTAYGPACKRPMARRLFELLRPGVPGRLRQRAASCPRAAPGEVYQFDQDRPVRHRAI
jgi:hypothetical protein